MPFLIKGFVCLDDLINNNSGTIAGIGEISPLNLTQSKEKQYFGFPEYQDLSLIVMHSTLGGIHQVTPTNLAKEILAVSKALKTFNYSDDFALQYRAEFPSHNDPRNGPIITYNGTTLPAWVSFKLQLTSDIAEIKVWYNDDKFGPEFGEHEIVIVPPVEPVSQLYSNHATVKELLAAEDFADTLIRINDAKGKYPPTQIKPIKLRWVEPSDPTMVHITTWSAVCYGTEAGRYDNILEAIRNYLVNNSNYNLTQWRNYLPEIQFARIYHLIPLWGQPSITAGPTTQNMYRPSIKESQILTGAMPFMPTTSEAEIREYGEFFSILYKSIGMICIGASGNGVGEKMFTDRYPDYTVIDLNSQNIDRISASTLSAIRQIERLVRLCEIDTGVNTLPTDVTRATVSGVTYLEISESGMIFRMVTKRTSDDILK